MKSTHVINPTQALAPSHTRLLTWATGLLWVGWIPLVLYLVFFASIQDMHNGMHQVRHASTVVQCH